MITPTLQGDVERHLGSAQDGIRRAVHSAVWRPLRPRPGPCLACPCPSVCARNELGLRRPAHGSARHIGIVIRRAREGQIIPRDAGFAEYIEYLLTHSHHHFGNTSPRMTTTTTSTTTWSKPEKRHCLRLNLTND